MTLKELIEKLEAARVLLGDEAEVELQLQKDASARWPYRIDKVTVCCTKTLLHASILDR